MSVMVFIGAGIAVIVAVVMLALAFGSSEATNTPLMGTAGRSVTAVMYLAIALLYVAPGVFLSRYASAIGRLAQDRSVAALEDALEHQRSFWRYAGTLTLIGTVLGILIIVLLIVGGLFEALAR
jgi:uncharacterized membrane protein